MKNIKKIGLIAPMLMLTVAVNAFAAMPTGTVVIGSKAYDLNYANNTNNQDEISNAVVNSGGVVYVKGFDGTWIDNKTGNPIDASKVPEVTYKKDATGTVGYKAGDGDPENVSNNGDFEVISID